MEDEHMPPSADERGGEREADVPPPHSSTEHPPAVKSETAESADGEDIPFGCWEALGAAPAELQCDVTLVCGQSFRWRETGEREWTGVVGDVMVSVRQRPSDVWLCAWEGGAQIKPSPDLIAAVRDYFALETPLAPLYQEWAEADEVCRQLAVSFPGLRVMRQDPVECLFSFICSSNNNIARITVMIERLSAEYGVLLGEHSGHRFYSFPPLHKLAAAPEDELRGLGVGYRAKFIRQSAATVIDNGGREWLMSLRSVGFEEAREKLMTLHGVGAKVADCVCLFCLDKHGLVPVDTHVWQISIRNLDPSLADAKSLTPTVYARVRDLWLSKYGAYAGWAHTILFAADLVKFKDRTEDALSPGKKSKKGTPKSTPNASPAKASPAKAKAKAKAKQADSPDKKKSPGTKKKDAELNAKAAERTPTKMKGGGAETGPKARAKGKAKSALTTETPRKGEGGASPPSTSPPSPEGKSVGAGGVSTPPSVRKKGRGVKSEEREEEEEEEEQRKKRRRKIKMEESEEKEAERGREERGERAERGGGVGGRARELLA